MEPTTITSLDTTVTLDLSIGGSSYVFPSSDVIYYSTADLGLVDLDFTYMGNSYTFSFYGHRFTPALSPFWQGCFQ